MTFGEFFQQATTNPPYGWQCRLAGGTRIATKKNFKTLTQREAKALRARREK
jgi:hypothetical protein